MYERLSPPPDMAAMHESLRQDAAQESRRYSIGVFSAFSEFREGRRPSEEERFRLSCQAALANGKREYLRGHADSGDRHFDWMVDGAIKRARISEAIILRVEQASAAARAGWPGRALRAFEHAVELTESLNMAEPADWEITAIAYGGLASGYHFLGNEKRAEEVIEASAKRHAGLPEAVRQLSPFGQLSTIEEV